MTPEQLKQQIEQEAEDYKAKPYYIDGSALSAAPQIYLKRGYIAGATAYATRAIAAEQEVERLRNALTLIEQMSDPGDYWKAICDMKSIASEALTPKTGEDVEAG